MKKKILLLSTLMALTLTSCAFASCKDNEKVAGVDFDVETLMMIPGDEASLIADYVYKDGANLRYTSSDESVVKVDEYGRLTAIKEGTATITVYYGKATDTCKVTVSMNGLLPLFQLSNVPTDEVSIYKSTDLDLSGQVLFNGKTYDDMTMTYEVSDKTVGKVENGVFKPLKTGTTEVNVTATWRGVSASSMTKTITIEVVPEMIFVVNDGVSEITLYTQNTQTANTVSPFEITAEYEGDPLPTTVEVTEGSNYVVYDEVNQTVKSCGFTGEAEITVSYEINGEVTEKKIPIHVKPTVYEYETTVTNFSAIHGDAVTGKPLRNILGGDIVSAQDADGNPLEVIDNKVFGVQSSKDGKFETTITVYSKTHGYKINVEGYSGVFAKAEDFAVFYTNASYASVNGSRKFHAIDDTKSMKKWEGYYVLANNIDASEYTHATVGEELSKRGIQSGGYGDVGFHGTFDGQGYTVKGMTVGAYGIFGYLCEATLKNVAFADVTLSDEADSSVFAAWVMDSTISNVYVSIANENKLSKTGSVFACGANASSFVGCVVETKAGFGYEGSINSGSFTYLNKERSDGDAIQSTFVDVFVISSEELGYYKSSSYYLQAENEKLTLEEGATAYTLGGVKRYETLAEMQSANNTYSYLSKDYWTVTNGAPVWKSLNGDYPSADDLVDDTVTEHETVKDFDTSWLL